MTYVIGLLCAVAVLLFIVGIHEAGHLVAAKLCKVGVVEYAIGMGPVLWHHRFGDTVYSFRAIPFGGYCAMYGEQSMEASGKGESKEEGEDGKRPRRDLGYKTDWRSDQTLQSKSWWQCLLIYMAGPMMNVVGAFLLCMVLVLFFSAATAPVVSDLMPDHPAEAVGIQPGDIISEVNGRMTLTFSDYSEYLDTHENLLADGYDITVFRDGQQVTFHATQDPSDGMFGVYVRSVPVDLTFENVMLYTVNTARYMLNTVGDSFYMLTHGTAGVQDLSGMVGVTAVIMDDVDSAITEAQESEHSNAVSGVLGIAFTLSALLCVNLAVVNLIPFPALDGGRVVMCLFEGVFRRKIPERVEYVINFAGMCLLLGLLVVTLLNDIIRIMGGIFS